MNKIGNCNHFWKNWNDISLTTSEKMDQKILDEYSTKVKCSKCDIVLLDYIESVQAKLNITSGDSSIIDERLAPMA